MVFVSVLSDSHSRSLVVFVSVLSDSRSQVVFVSVLSDSHSRSQVVFVSVLTATVGLKWCLCQCCLTVSL